MLSKDKVADVAEGFSISLLDCVVVIVVVVKAAAESDDDEEKAAS